MDLIVGTIFGKHQAAARSEPWIQIPPSVQIGSIDQKVLELKKIKKSPELSSDILTPESTGACQRSQCLKIQRGLTAVEMLPA